MLLNDLTKEEQKQQKTNKTTKVNVVVRVRIELTTLALSAPRSADWANGPTAVLQWLKYIETSIISFQVTWGSDFKGYQLLW